MLKYYIIVPIIIAIAGLAVIIPIGVVQYNHELANNKKTLVSLTDTYKGFISRTNLGLFVDIGDCLRHVYEVKPDLSREEHIRIASEQATSASSEVRIGYVTAVLDADRTTFENEASIWANETIFIKDGLNGPPIGTRPIYYPLSVTYPPDATNNRLFYDLTTIPIAPVFINSFTNNVDSISDPVYLSQDPGTFPHYVTLFPVYVGNYTGTVTVTFNLQEQVIARLSNTVTREVGIHVFDKNGVLVVGVCGAENWVTCSPPTTNLGKDASNFTILDSTWSIEVTAIGILEPYTYFYTFAIGLPILIVVIVVTFWALFIMDRQLLHQKTINDTEKTVMSMKQRFIHYIFHEIRVPFQTIKLGLMNLKTYLPESNQDALNTWMAIDNSISHATHILNDMLDVGKMEKGKFEVAKKYDDLVSSIDLILAGYKSAVESKGLQFSSYIHPDIKSHLFNCDLGRLCQCINNLLSNAQKFTSEGNIQFRIDIIDRVLTHPEIWNIKISVIDSGIGIKEDDQLKLFQAYHQIQNASHEVGTGLGLVIIKNIVQAHNGTVGFESEYKNGSTFWFTVPLEVQVMPENYRRDSSEMSDIPHNILQLSVLIVDDNKNNCFAFGEYLKNVGFTSIEIAYDGYQALSKIEEHGLYDLIFMDYNMPKMDGIECVSEIRRRYGDNSQAYITMVTGAYMDHEFIKSKGVDEVMQKPLDTKKLARTMNILNKKYHAHDQELPSSDVGGDNIK